MNYYYTIFTVINYTTKFNNFYKENYQLMDKKYKRMINVMLLREEAAKKKKTRGKKTPKSKVKSSDPWFVYILVCRDGTFYTGITKDLDRRLKMHNDGKASRYTRTRGPVRLVYHEKHKNRAQALVRECAIKGFPRKKKQKLIDGTNN